MPAKTPLFVYGIIVVAGRLLLARVLDRFRPLLLGAVALVIIGGGLMIMALWTTPLGMVLGAAVFALGITLSTPAFFSAIFATARLAERGAASGTASVFLDLAYGWRPDAAGVCGAGQRYPLCLWSGGGSRTRWSSVNPPAARHLATRGRDDQFVGVAPEPVLTRLQRLHDPMFRRIIMRVPAGVLFFEESQHLT